MIRSGRVAITKPAIMAPILVADWLVWNTRTATEMTCRVLVEMTSSGQMKSP